MTTGIVLLLVGLGLVFVVGPMLGFNLGFDWLKKDSEPQPQIPANALEGAQMVADQQRAAFAF